MRILVNTLSVTDEKVGIQTYLLGLVRALLDVDADNEYVLLCGRHNEALFAPFTDGPNGRAELARCKLATRGAAARIYYDQCVVPSLVRRANAEVLLTPSNIATLRCPAAQVLVVQNALVLRTARNDMPSETVRLSRLHRAYFDAFGPRSLRAASVVVAVSGFIADHLRRIDPSAASKVQTVLEGVDLAWARACPAGPSPVPAVPYVLWVGTLFDYKRPDVLLKAFAKLRESSTAPRLKIVGRAPSPRRLAMLRSLAVELGIAGQVDWLGALPHASLPALYRGARALAFCSSFESFGLPVLEAMACGAPVVAADQPATREVLGEAGLLVPVGDIGATAEAMRRVCEDDALRDRLITSGRARAEQLTWYHTARAFVGLFDQVRAGPGH